ncbi:MAG: hypothetical protein JXR87_10120 [Candidatus Marinimicrobia bacterium]|nr:hypothetical protein [Candidatus Neomarinimicrobiota bacterium]
MRKKILALLIAFNSLLISENLSKQYSDFGDLIFYSLETAPFPHPKRSNGHNYDGKFYSAEDHYQSNRVAVFIPKDFRSDGKIDFVVHFHGWWNSVDSVLVYFRLIEQFTQSGKNAILVVPQGPLKAPDSFGGKLEDENGFSNFMNELIQRLVEDTLVSSKKPGTIILSGHSGGYHVISYILLRGGLTRHIKEVFLFDALYGQMQKFCHWIKNYNGKLINIYTENGGTKWESEAMMEDFNHWKIPYYSCMETELIDNLLRESEVTFIYSGDGHNEVVHLHNSFRHFLSASQLKDK